MNSPPFLLVLLFLSSCHGGEQDNSSPSGILTTTKAQKELQATLEVPCPEPTDIQPCECFTYQDFLIMNCSKVQDEDQLRRVFSASFPTTDFYRFDMSFNKGVKVLEDGVFGDVSFHEFTIAFSALETVRNDVLTPSLSTLTSIYIDVCELAIFPFERLPEFTSLTMLSLDSNKIHSLPPLSSSSLHVLDLTHNPISLLSPDVFTLLPNVEWIYLDGCSLTEITPGTFQGLTKLATLSLSGNKISYLHSLTFYLLPNGLLQLNNNNIDFVEVDAFKGVQEESSIDMSNNTLTKLGEEVWRTVLEKDINVYLEGNPLACDCDVAWLVRNPQLLGMAQFGRCADGTLLTDLDPADFDHCG